MATRPGATKRARLSTWPSVWSFIRPASEPDHALEAEVARAAAASISSRVSVIAVGVEQALLGGDDGARAVAVDRAAFEDPVGLGEGQPSAARRAARRSSWSPSRSYLPPQPLKPKPCAPPLVARADDDRPGVAQPDVAERLDDDVGERREPARGFRGALVGGDQPHRLALAAGVHRLGEGRDLALGVLEIAEPQLGIARKADPHRLVRRPFGRRRGWRSVAHATPLTAEHERAKSDACNCSKLCEVAAAEAEGISTVRVRDLMTAAAAAAFFVSAGAGAQQVHSLAEDAAAFGERSGVEAMAVSPDGTKLVYIGPAKDRWSAVMVVDVATGVDKPIMAAHANPEVLRWCNFVGNDRLVCRITWTSRDSILISSTLVGLRR